jgi:hypothetical protein
MQTRYRIVLRALLASVAILSLGAWGGCNAPSSPHSATQGALPANPTPAAPTTNTGTSLFADVTRAAGINYRWEVEGKRPLNILQTIGNGCAFLDYNNDGNLDILLVGPKLALYQGDGKGHFTDVSHETGLDALHGHFLGCAVGDYDNDGYDDLYISAYRGGLLLHNEGGKRFQDVTAQSGIAPQRWGTSCTFVDLDGDGKLDLYICNYVKYDLNTQPQLCNYSGFESACGPRFYQPEIGVLYHNEGGGKFRDVTAAWGINKILGDSGQGVNGKGLGVATADYNGSGRMSLEIANDEVAGDLLENDGHKFHNIGASSGTAYDSAGNVHGGMGVDWGDYDNDGKLDLAVATFQHEPKCLYHNDGKGYFTESSAPLGIADKTQPYVSFGIKFFDYDNDGWLDLIVASGHVQDNINAIDKSTTYRQKPQLFHNLKGKSFEETTAQAGEGMQKEIVGRGLAVGDFDNDGRMDALIVDSEGEPILLHNQVPNAGHWLLCKLIGTKSNRDGLGAQLTAEAGGIKLLRQCTTDGSYMSASDRRVHFGLGSATTATITVRWPSGATNTYQNVPADRIVTLHEGDPTVH